MVKKIKNSYLFSFVLFLGALIYATHFVGCASTDSSSNKDILSEGKSQSVGSKKKKNKLSQIPFEKKKEIYGLYTAWSLLENKNQRKEGIDFLKKLTELAPDSGYFWSLYSENLFLIGEREKGKEAIQKAIEVAPDSLDARNLYGDLLRIEGKKQESLEQFQISLEHDPNDIKALQEVAALYFENAEYPKSRDCYNKLIKLNNSGAPVYYHNVGLCYLQEGKFQEAADFFKKVIDLRPDYRSTYRSLAEAYEKK